MAGIWGVAEAGCVVLLVSEGLSIRSFANLLNADFGYISITPVATRIILPERRSVTPNRLGFLSGMAQRCGGSRREVVGPPGYNLSS